MPSSVVAQHRSDAAHLWHYRSLGLCSARRHPERRRAGRSPACVRCVFGSAQVSRGMELDTRGHWMDVCRRLLEEEEGSYTVHRRPLD